MTKVQVDISMSLDGYIDAVGITPDEPMGRGGEALHQWLEDMDELSARALERGHSTGVIICGRRTFERSLPWWEADGPSGSARVPVLVLAHSVPDQVPADSVYRFVDGEPQEVLVQAQKVAGDADVTIMGGAIAIQQFLSAGLVDEIHLHLVPVLLGGGTRLFDLDLPAHVHLRQDNADLSPAATHLSYHVPR
jgi:dihydrofolate reductase